MRPCRVDDVAMEGLDLVGVADVAGDEARRPCTRPALGSMSVATTGAGRGEGGAGGDADAAARAGHERDLAAQGAEQVVEAHVTVP